MSDYIIVSRTQCEEPEVSENLRVHSTNNNVVRSNGNKNALNALKLKDNKKRVVKHTYPTNKGDYYYGVASFVPDKMLMTARKNAGRDKTSIECAVGQRKVFRALMEETKERRSSQQDSAHDKLVGKWSALLPQPNWSHVLSKKKPRTKNKMFVVDKKKQVIQKELDKYAAKHYDDPRRKR